MAKPQAPASPKPGCCKCPFNPETRHLSRETDEELRALMQRNYDTIPAARETWPNWKPGLCHTGKRLCAGFIEKGPIPKGEN